MNNKIILTLGVLIGVVFLILAFVYWLTPAQSLPSFLPGFEAGLTKIHYKHGIAALILSLGIFAFCWFQSGPKSSHKK